MVRMPATDCGRTSQSTTAVASPATPTPKPMSLTTPMTFDSSAADFPCASHDVGTSLRPQCLSMVA